MDAIHTVEILITLWFQSWGQSLSGLMTAISFFGTEEFYIFALPILYWCVDTRLGIQLGIIFFSSNMVNGFFKQLWRQPRPYWFDSRVKAFSSETSFGIPSGHAQLSSSALAPVMMWAKRRWVTILGLVVLFLIGVSRIILGMHFTTDVLTGWLLTLCVLYIYTNLEKPVEGWLRKLKLGSLLGVCYAASLGILLISAIPLWAAANWQPPAEWNQRAIAAGAAAIDPLNPNGMFTLAGVFFGMMGGAAILFRRFGGYSPKGTLRQHALRLLIGFVGIGLLWFVLGKVFPRNLDALSMILRYVRYMLVGLWITLAAPLLFIRFKLAEAIPAPMKRKKKSL